MNRLEGRFAARQIPGGREYQEDDYGLIERDESDADGGEVLVARRRDGGARERRHGQQDRCQDVRGNLSRHGWTDPGSSARLPCRRQRRPRRRDERKPRNEGGWGPRWSWR